MFIEKNFFETTSKHFVDFHIFEWKHKYKQLKRNSIFCYNDVKQLETSHNLLKIQCLPFNAEPIHIPILGVVLKFTGLWMDSCQDRNA